MLVMCECEDHTHTPWNCSLSRALSFSPSLGFTLSPSESVRTTLKSIKTSQIEGLKGTIGFLRFIRVEPYPFQVRNSSKTHGIRTPFLCHYSYGRKYDCFRSFKHVGSFRTSIRCSEKKKLKCLNVRKPEN